MGKNSYNGGGTIVHAGSGFFSHKGGGPGLRRKTIDTAQKKKVIEFQTKTKEQRSIETRESW
ncbi:hypothetical protein [Rhizobium ruizarguesonis]|jgi:hypothetical protein|uniref:hypothetical protein n=1 Tax=Rhizobium ruizarguesonis TaxID=2081791 RepID=UPI0010315ED4|nr:hypothetical protein [Rhizobium ruizarguesonis]TAV00323.1 hypothetical protein ELI39_30965 [Rhizobium ruizarguesonis]